MSLGWLLLRRLGLEFHRGEGALFAFVSGSAVLSLAVFGLCLVHEARLGVFLDAEARWRAGWAIWEGTRIAASWRLALLFHRGFGALLFATVFAAFLACYFCNAVAPEISPDGSSYHLGNVARYWRHRGFDWDYHSIYSSLSQGMEMLFLVAFSGLGKAPGGRPGPHGISSGVLPLMILLLRSAVWLRLGLWPSPGLLVYASPVVGINGDIRL